MSGKCSRLDMCRLHHRSSISWSTCWRWGSGTEHTNLLLFVVVAAVFALNNAYDGIILIGGALPLGLPILPVAASETISTRHVGPLPLSASDAMRHTLSILYPEKSRDLRRLSHLPNKFNAVYTPNPKALCEQSRYLCHINQMQNPNVKSVSEVQQAGDKDSFLAFGVPISPLGSPKPLSDLERAATLPNGLVQTDTTTTQDTEFSLPSIFKSGFPRRLYSADVDHPENGRIKDNDSHLPTEAIRRVESNSSSGFIKVHQQNRLENEFRPLRIKPTFHDFREEVNNPTAENSTELSRHRPSPGESKVVLFADLLRFFQVDVVPAALWWVERTITVMRRNGPIVIENSGRTLSVGGSGKIDTTGGSCGHCTLPKLRQYEPDGWQLGDISVERDGSTKMELHDADFLLMFRTSDVATKSPAEICQVDDEYRPIAACVTVSHSEARDLYHRRESSFPEVVAIFLSKIINAFALNVQMFPYFMSHHPTWRRKALKQQQKLRPGSHPSFNHVITKVLVPDVTPKSHSAMTGGSDRESPYDRAARYFLSTPRVTNIIRELFSCHSALGLELAAGDSEQKFTAFFHPRIAPEEIFTADPIAGKASSLLTLAAIEDSGWYHTDDIWVNHSIRGRVTSMQSPGCGYLLGSYMDLLPPKQELSNEELHCSPDGLSRALCKQKRLAGSSTSVSVDDRKLNHEKVDSLPPEHFSEANQGVNIVESKSVDCIVGYTPLFLHNELSCTRPRLTSLSSRVAQETNMAMIRSQQSQCLRSNISLSSDNASSKMTSGCYRILCVSNNDEIEVPLMIPTTNATKWVAAQIIGRLRDDTPGSFICPDIDAVCYGRPCLNGGVASYGVCACPAGTFGRNCEFLDTEINRLRLPNRFSYNPHSNIVILRGKFFAIRPTIGGPQNLSYKAISTLPPGIRIDPKTGDLYGTPIQKTAGTATCYLLEYSYTGRTVKGYTLYTLERPCTEGCTPLVIEAQMHEIPHAAERTIVRIHVVDHLLRKMPLNLNKASLSNPLQVTFSQDSQEASYSHQSTGVQMSNEMLTEALHVECGTLVTGDVRPPLKGVSVLEQNSDIQYLKQ